MLQSELDAHLPQDNGPHAGALQAQISQLVTTCSQAQAENEREVLFGAGIFTDPF